MLRFHSATISLLKGSISTSTASRGPVHLIFSVTPTASWQGSEQKCSGVGHWCGVAISDSLCRLLSVTLKSALHSTDVKAPAPVSAQALDLSKHLPENFKAIYGSNAWEKAFNEGTVPTSPATRFCLNYPSLFISYFEKIILETLMRSLRLLLR